MEEFDVGQVIAGKYELVRLLGKGAMGAVWLAKHHTLDEKFAVKLIRTDMQEVGDPDEAAGRFQQEAQLSASLSRRTRHIVSVIDHGEYDGWAYLVMEALEGESLEDRLKRGPMTPAETADVVGQIARGVTVAHNDLVYHRDLKPANIFLVKDEEGRLVVKLLDFGIARSIRPKGTKSPFATTKDVVLGTPSYMSPEQARGLDTLDHRCDLWALAVVAYECLTGETPWEGENVQEVFLAVCTHQWVPARTRNPDLPYVVDAVFSRAFAFELDERFGSAKELAATLRAAFPTAMSAQGGRTAFASRASFSEEDLGPAALLAQAVAPGSAAARGPVTGSGRFPQAHDGVAETMQSARTGVLTDTGSELVPAGLKRSPTPFGRLFLGAAVVAFLLLTGIAVWWGVFESAASATPPALLTSPPPRSTDVPPDPPPVPVATTAATPAPSAPVQTPQKAPASPARPPLVSTPNVASAPPVQALPVATPPAASGASGAPPRPRDKSDVF